jgi:hypothetical protein
MKYVKQCLVKLIIPGLPLSYNLIKILIYLLTLVLSLHMFGFRNLIKQSNYYTY